MKIGILTLPFNNNYGGYLQSFALMTVLKREGHNVELIYRRHNKTPFSIKIISTIKNIIKVLLGRKIVSIIPDEEKSFRARGVNMMPFLDNLITPKSKPLYSSEEFNEYVTGRYDAVIVGSDQVWRPDYVPDIRDYFLCGISDEKLVRLSYSASFGTDNPRFTDEEKYDCSKALSKFMAVSVREASGLDIVRQFGYFNPELVLDPTLLLTADDYNAILPPTNSPSKGKVFCYVLDSNKESEKIISEICRIKEEERYSIADIQKGNRILPSVETWLMAIRDADMVITDSFHGMVFSVIYRKEFVVCPNMKRGVERFTSFLNQFSLESRIVKSVEKLFLPQIDWGSVEWTLETKREISLKFLKSILV